MGMYDMLGSAGEQVKCFDVYYPTYKGDIACSGGSLKSYRAGDEVPYQSWSYDYGTDFFIIDPDEDAIIHVIVNSMYFGTVPEKNWNTLIFDRCIDRLGCSLKNIYSADDAKLFVRVCRQVQHQVFETLKDKTYLDAYHNYIQAVREHFEDQNVVTKLQQEYEAQADRIHEQIRQIRSKLDTWYDEKKFELYDLGCLLECIRNGLQRTDIDLTPYLDKLKLVIEKNPNCLDEYIQWSSTGPQAWQEEVKRTIGYVNGI